MQTHDYAEPQVHLICQAHIDPVWIWDWPEGATETLATFEAAADLLDEYPEFVFNHNESLLYEWTKRYRPDLYARIQEHVRNGRWIISGGWYLQPDLNLPCGESIARQILIGRQFFAQEFGVEPRVAYNLDSFGHNGNLPQFLRLSGYELYTHFRPHPNEKTLPDHLYRWRGVDGTDIPAFRPPDGWYCTHPGSLVADKIEQMRELAESSGRSTSVFWGAGNHGGGATREDLDTIRGVAERSPEVVHSSFEQFLVDVVRPRAESLPLAEGELQKCFTGCYTSVIENKLQNRRAEGLALASERFAALAWWFADSDYPFERIDGVWKDLLFCQFHDMLPGSSIREGVVSSRDFVGRSVANATDVLLAAQLELIRSAERRSPLTVRLLNPHPVVRKLPVIIDVQLATHPALAEGKYLGVYDSSGREIPRQLLEYQRSTADWRNTFLFEAELPPMGLAEYSIRIEESEAAAPSPDQIESANPDAFLAASGRRLYDSSCRVADTGSWFSVGDQTISVNTAFYSASVSLETGGLSSLYDRASDREFISGSGPRLIVREDSNNAWGGEQNSYGRIVGEFMPAAEDEMSEISGQYGDHDPGPPVRVISAGPIALTIESLLTWKRSLARMRITFFRDHRQVDIDLTVNWAERRRALQLEIPTSVRGPLYEAEIPHAAISRPTGGGEEPCGRWVQLRDQDAVALLVNDGTGGVEVADGVLRQTLVRSPVYCSGTDSVEQGFLGEHMDLGEHRYRFRLLIGQDADVIPQRQLSADDLSLPLSNHTSVPLGPSHKVGVSPGRSLLVLTPLSGDGHVHMEALKASADKAGLVIRLAERAGAATRVRLELADVESADLDFRPYEMKTLRCEKNADGRQGWTEVDLLERPPVGMQDAWIRRANR